MKLLTLYEGTQFATNLSKSCIKQQKTFRADIFFEFDLENNLLSFDYDRNVKSIWEQVQSIETPWKPYYRHQNR